MSSDEGEDGPIGTPERELLIEQYLALRDEINTLIKNQNQREGRGVAALAAVLGYALLAESQWIIAFTPFIIGTIFINSITTAKTAFMLSRHMIDIENRLSDLAPHFCWESKYGGIYGREPSTIRQYRFDVLPELSALITATAAYIFLIFLSYKFWRKRPSELRFVDQQSLLLFYTIYTLFLLLIGLIVIWYYFELKPVGE